MSASTAVCCSVSAESVLNQPDLVLTVERARVCDAGDRVTVVLWPAEGRESRRAEGGMEGERGPARASGLVG